MKHVTAAVLGGLTSALLLFHADPFISGWFGASVFYFTYNYFNEL